MTDAPPPAGKPVAFIFKHKALSMEGTVFALHPTTGEAVMRVDLGDTRGSVPLAQVRTTFQIPAASEDARLLSLVEKSLRHVRIIRPGDRIPSEILDGSASWTIDDRHREMAYLKLSTALLSRLGVEAGAAESEQAKGQIKERGDALARLVGLPEDRRQEVVDRVEMLANELAFIEALRDFWKPLFDLPRKLRDLGKQATLDREFSDEIRRVQGLLKSPVDETRAALDAVDERLADLAKALTEFERTVKLIRGRRDGLHARSLEWAPLLETWKAIRVERGEGALAVGPLYRFLAPRYLNTKVWAGS